MYIRCTIKGCYYSCRLCGKRVSLVIFAIYIDMELTVNHRVPSSVPTIQWAWSEKGKPLAIFEGHKFCFHKDLANSLTRFICVKKGCKAFLKIDEQKQLKDQNLNHNHVAIEQNILNRQVINNSVKRKAVDQINSRPQKLVCNEVRTANVNTLTTKDVSLISKCISRARLLQYPKLPKTVNDFHVSLSKLTIISNSGEQFLLVNDNLNNVVLFSTKTNLKFICNSKLVFVDGTFYSCPKQFSQLFIIHGFKENVYVPVAFFLLPNKLQRSYELAFNYLISECAKINAVFSPERIFVDFEYAIHAAIRNTLPNAELQGSRFHLGQSWYRKIQQLGLSGDYRHNTDIGKFCKLFFGLPFLKPEEVGDSFADELMSIQPIDERVSAFCDYIVDNYIAENAPFPPIIWAKYSHSTTRTTNSCEAFHSKFNSSFSSSNPNMYTFLDALRDIDIMTNIKLRSTGAKSKQKIYKENFIADRMMERDIKLISDFEFVKKLSHKFLPI